MRKTSRRMSFIAFLKIFFSDLRNCCVGILLIVKYKRCDQWTKKQWTFICQTLRWGFSSHFLHSGNWRLKEFFSPFCYFAYQVTSVENIELVQAEILPGKFYKTPWLHEYIYIYINPSPLFFVFHLLPTKEGLQQLAHRMPY